MNLFAAEYQPTAAAVLLLASISNNPNFLLVKVLFGIEATMNIRTL